MQASVKLTLVCVLAATQIHASFSTVVSRALHHDNRLAARASLLDSGNQLGIHGNHLVPRAPQTTDTSKTKTKPKKDASNTASFDGTAQDKFCQPYVAKGGPPIPDDLKCPNSYDINDPTSTIEQFLKLKVPISGVRLYHHGYDVDPNYTPSQLAYFSCDCDSAANAKYTELISNWTGDTDAYRLDKGEAPFVTIPFFGHDAKKWSRIYVVTACAIAAVTPEFWKQTHFSCGYYDLSKVTANNFKIVSDQNEGANEIGLADTRFEKVPYPPTGRFLDPNDPCKECDDYNPQTGKYDYNASNKNFVSHGHKCINGPDEANKGECNPESKLPDWPKGATSVVDKYCQDYQAKEDHSSTPAPFYPIDNPTAVFQKFTSLGGTLGGYREVRTPASDAQNACYPLPDNVAMFEACDCHQISAAKRLQLNAGGSRKSKKTKRAGTDSKASPAASDKPEYIALSVLGKDLCWNDHYYAAGCAIAKVKPAFYDQAKRTGAIYDFSKVTKDNVEIVQNYGGEQEVLAQTPVGKGQGLEAAPYPPHGADFALTKAQQSCIKDQKISCAGVIGSP